MVSLFTCRISKAFTVRKSLFGFKHDRVQMLSSMPLMNSVAVESNLIQKTESVNIALNDIVSLCENLEVRKAMHYTLHASRGKRVRPMLCLAACELVGGDDSTAMPAACGVEMMHMSSFVQVIPTGDHQSDEATEVLAANEFMILANKHTMEATQGVSPKIILDVALEMAVAKEETMERQAMMDSEMRIGKNGSLFEAAGVMGAILGGGLDEEIERVRLFSRCVGLRLMDVRKSSENLGKATGKDMIAGKHDLPMLEEARREAFEHLQPFDAEKVTQIAALINYLTYTQN